VKLHKSKILPNMDKFRCNPYDVVDNLMRGNEGSFLVWKTIEYTRPKSILEIGFGCGQTLGLMLESAGDECQRIVSNDIDYSTRKTQFDILFPDNKVEFIELPSQQLKLNEKFDFIMIDGDHSYQGALSDINLCFSLLNDHSILCIDNYTLPSVDKAIKEAIIDGQSNWVPFFAGQQQIFFQYDYKYKEDYTKWLTETHKRFIKFDTADYYGYNMLQGRMYDPMFIKSNEIFRLALEFYNF